MTLFQGGRFQSHSGLELDFKIDCDALTLDDWECLAQIAQSLVAPFSEVEGVPQGGLKFAHALRPHRSPDGGLLIVDDVLTTGTSMEEARAGRHASGLVVFSRALPVQRPAWVQAVYTIHPALVQRGAGWWGYEDPSRA